MAIRSGITLEELLSEQQRLKPLVDDTPAGVAAAQELLVVRREIWRLVVKPGRREKTR